MARARTGFNRVVGELRAHKESAARAEVQWRQRQHDYDELTAEQEQIQTKSPGTFVLDRLPASKDQGLLRNPRDGLHLSRFGRKSTESAGIPAGTCNEAFRRQRCRRSQFPGTQNQLSPHLCPLPNLWVFRLSGSGFQCPKNSSGKSFPANSDVIASGAAKVFVHSGKLVLEGL